MFEARFAYVRAVTLVAASVLLVACGSNLGANDDTLGADAPGADGGPCLGDSCEGNATPTDGEKNTDETDVDCGGAHAPKCADGKGCLAETDCESTYCTADTKICTAPRPDDGAKNADETDIDCGGAIAPKCATGKGCAKHEDCESDACNYAGKCIPSRSCVLHHGGDTCGPTNAQGDCCESIEVPRPEANGGAYKLDKYVVTSGRMRAFVERTNGDIRGWMQAHRPAWFKEAWDDYLPTTLDDPDDGWTGRNGVYQQLGPWAVYGTGAEDANRGCNVEGPGARTYWIPSDVNDRWEDRQRYTKEDLDEKALICVTQYMMAAFCAWDGGRLPTTAETQYAYRNGGTTTYPWGNSPAPGAFGYAPLDAAEAGTPPNSSRFANKGYNWWSPAQRIDNDYSVYVAPPGRFPDGYGKWGHADLAGIMLPWTSDMGNGTANVVWTGSWEATHHAHAAPLTLPALYKYYAIGGRCAR